MAQTTPARGALRLRCTSEDEPSSWPRSEPPSTTLRCSSGPLSRELAGIYCTLKPAGGTVVIREDNLTATSYEAPAPMAAGNYRFWVKAINAADNVSGFWSEPTDFTIVNAEQFTLPFDNGNDNNGEREAAGNSLLANLLQVPLADHTAAVRFNPPTVPTQLSPQSKHRTRANKRSLQTTRTRECPPQLSIQADTTTCRTRIIRQYQQATAYPTGSQPQTPRPNHDRRTTTTQRSVTTWNANLPVCSGSQRCAGLRWGPYG